MVGGRMARGSQLFAGFVLALAAACEDNGSQPGGSAGSTPGGASGSGDTEGGAGTTAGAPSAGSSAAPGVAGMSGASAAGIGGEDSGGASADLGGAAGESPEAGSGGVSGGAGGGSFPTCDTAPSETKIQGCILDAAGVKSTTLAKTAVTVIAIGGGSDASGCSTDTSLTTELRLRAADSREWSYFVYVPDRPLGQVQVGDALELSVAVHQPNFFDQTVVLGRGNDLVLFSVASWQPNVPDLSDYGTSVTIGAPYCLGSSICGATQFRSLQVTRGAASAELLTGQKKVVAGLSVSLQAISEASGLGCDPATVYRYGGFMAP